MKRWLTLIISVIVGLGLLIAILYYVGWRRILSEILDLGWFGFSMLFLNMILTIVLWVISWQLILCSYGLRPSWLAILKARLSGFSVSYLTPSMYFGGEPVMAYLISKELGASSTKVFATVMVTKFLEAISLVAFVYLGSFYAIFMPNLPHSQQSALFYGTIVFSILVLLGFIDFAYNRLWATRLLSSLGQILPWWQGALGKAASVACKIEEDINLAFRSHLPATLAALVTNFIGTLLTYLRPQIFFYFSQHRIFTFPELSLIFALNILLAVFFWVTPGGIGVSEGGRIGIFKLVNISTAGAVAFSFTLKAIELFFVGLGLAYIINFGLFSLVRVKPKPKQKQKTELTTLEESSKASKKS